MIGKRRIAAAEHEVAYNDLVKLCSKHADKLSKMELLAIAANMVGKLLALQDQRTMTPNQGLQLIARNIEVGNRQAIENIANEQPKGNA